MAISIGQLNKRVILRAPSIVQNGEGGRETTYPSDSIATFAHVKDVNQYRVEEAARSALVGTKEFYIRYADSRKSVNKDWQLVYGEKVFQIHAIERIKQGFEFIKIVAKAK